MQQLSKNWKLLKNKNDRIPVFWICAARYMHRIHNESVTIVLFEPLLVYRCWSPWRTYFERFLIEWDKLRLKIFFSFRYTFRNMMWANSCKVIQIMSILAINWSNSVSPSNASIFERKWFELMNSESSPENPRSKVVILSTNVISMFVGMSIGFWSSNFAMLSLIMFTICGKIYKID